MKQISINGTARTDLGKKATKEIRKNGNVPCVIYGEKKDEKGAPVAIHFSVSEKEINKLIYTPHIYLIDINIDGEDTVKRALAGEPVGTLVYQED